MSKMKKLLAMFLALAMVLGMSISTMAAEKTSATIKIENAENATLGYTIVIEPDTSAATGWKFSSSIIEGYYKTAFGVNDPQAAIAMLIKVADPSADLPTNYENVDAATAAQINSALQSVVDGFWLAQMRNPQTVNKAGVYAILASEAGYSYKAMAAYVGFGGVNVDGDGETYDYPSLMDAKLNAKKVPTTLTKNDNDADNAVAIGQEVTYTLTTTFPYFGEHETNRRFSISDSISGAEYVGLVDDPATEENEKTATVQIGNETVPAEFVQAEDGGSFVVDLSAYADEDFNNQYANKTVVVTYKAVMSATEIENTATSHIGDEDVDSETIKHYTGEIALVKVDADDNNKKLANAGFEVKDAEGNVLTFVQKDATQNIYTYDPDGTVVEVFTGMNGEVIIEGLDIGTYTFAEKTAPKGYSINENPEEVVLTITEANENNEATDIFVANGTMEDTKLVALPSTGGIGTTIFTVAGCGIMIAAAYLFFNSRRREEA